MLHYIYIMVKVIHQHIRAHNAYVLSHLLPHISVCNFICITLKECKYFSAVLPISDFYYELPLHLARYCVCSVCVFATCASNTDTQFYTADVNSLTFIWIVVVAGSVIE